MPVQFFIKVDMKMPNAVNNAVSQFSHVFNLFEETKSVFQGISATKNIHQDSIIDESILNVNL